MIESFHRCFSLIANRQILNERFACSWSRITGIESENSGFRQRRHRKEGDKKIEEFGWKGKLPMNRFEAIEKTIGRTCMNFARNIRQLCFTSIISLFMFQFAFILASTAPRSILSLVIFFIFTLFHISIISPCYCLKRIAIITLPLSQLCFALPIHASFSSI